MDGSALRRPATRPATVGEVLAEIAALKTRAGGISGSGTPRSAIADRLALLVATVPPDWREAARMSPRWTANQLARAREVREDPDRFDTARVLGPLPEVVPTEVVPPDRADGGPVLSGSHGMLLDRLRELREAGDKPETRALRRGLVLDAWQAGAPGPQIAEAAGLTLGHVYYVMNKYRAPDGFVRRQAWRPSPEAAAQLRRWYVDEGLSVREVAAKLGVSAATARSRLGQAGVPIRPSGKARARREPL